MVEIRQFLIGFNSVWTDFADKVLGIPQVVQLEGGLTKEVMRPLGTLQMINDEGYNTFSVKVFCKNFDTLAPHDTLQDTLGSLGNHQVQYFRLRFRRPVVTFVETLSHLSNKMY